MTPGAPKAFIRTAIEVHSSAEKAPLFEFAKLSATALPVAPCFWEASARACCCIASHGAVAPKAINHPAVATRKTLPKPSSAPFT